MKGASVQIENISKRFGEVTAVQAVNLSVREGEFVTLLGPSGCGKTTLLRVIAGLEEPDEGRVVIGSQDMTGVPPERRPVNMVFQRYALFPHMNVFDNVAFSQVLKGRPPAEIEARVGEMLALVALTGYQGRRVNQLSGGQAQRVALARSLINEPRVLLLDEPLGALDLQIRKQMQLELKGIQARLGTNFIYVTHDQEEAMVMSDRIVLMNHGQVVQVGTPEELYNTPVNAFAARFIGEANVLHGEVRQVDLDGVAVAVGDVLVRAPAHPGAVAGQPALLSVRPERIRLADARSDDGQVNHVSAVVAAMIFLGSAVKYEMVLDGADARVIVTRPAAEAGEARRPGERVGLVWAREDAVVLAGGEAE